MSATTKKDLARLRRDVDGLKRPKVAMPAYLEAEAAPEKLAVYELDEVYGPSGTAPRYRRLKPDAWYDDAWDGEHRYAADPEAR
jgi:hypothetical protein